MTRIFGDSTHVISAKSPGNTYKRVAIFYFLEAPKQAELRSDANLRDTRDLYPLSSPSRRKSSDVRTEYGTCPKILQC